MSEARDFLIAQLEAQLPGVDVLPATSAPLTNLTRDTVLVRFDKVVPVAAVRRAREYAGALLAISPITTSDEVDDLREDVLDVCDRTRGITWSEAERATVDDRWPAWEVSFRFPLKFHDL